MRGVPWSGTSRPLPVWCRKVISTLIPHVMVISAWLILFLSIPFQSICSFPAPWQFSSFFLLWSCKSFLWAFLILPGGGFCPEWAGISGTNVWWWAAPGVLAEERLAGLCCAAPVGFGLRWLLPHSGISVHLLVGATCPSLLILLLNKHILYLFLSWISNHYTFQLPCLCSVVFLYSDFHFPVISLSQMDLEQFLLID